ncbi:hypothetical protein ACFE04_008785 [Oxalis oulophora]
MDHHHHHHHHGLEVKEEEETTEILTVSSSSSSSNSTSGFRKVDPDRWEFANEGFLGGKKHLLKNIKRRRYANTQQQQGGGGGGGEGVCVEVGQYDGEIERLKRERNSLMTELVNLRQQQQHSRKKVIAMEDRLLSTEKKQQQIMTFLAKALNNPSFVNNLRGGIEVGRKRRLTTVSPSAENLQHALDYQSQEVEIESLFSSALAESSKELEDPNAHSIIDDVNDTIWDELLQADEQFIVGDGSDIDVQVEDLVAKSPEWSEGMQDLVDQMGLFSHVETP